MLLGIAEERGGRRGAGNAIANTGVAALCALLALLTPSADAARLAFVAALAAAGSDTIASEIGKAWGRRTWSITSLKHVPPGTSGAMSIEGTAAGVVGALALGLAGSLLHLVPESAIMIVAVGAVAGGLLESWLGATLEGPGVLNNDMLNFINTATAAFVAAPVPLMRARLLLESQPAVHARRAGARLRVRRADRVGAAPREPWQPSLLIVAPLDRIARWPRCSTPATTR